MGNLVFQATLGGQVNLVGPNTASTYNINVPAVAGTMVTTGDTGTVTNTMLAGSIANAKLLNSSVTIGSTSVALGATVTAFAGITTLAMSSDLTLSGGTANGVAYLNGSKVVNTGSALTFDGTNFGIGLATPAGYGISPRAYVQQAADTAWKGLVIGAASSDAFLGVYYDGSVFNYSASYGSTAGYKPQAWQIGGSEQMRLTSTGLGVGTTSPNANTKIDASGPIRAGGYTVATLPTGVVGARAYVTDAVTAVFMATPTGGGSVKTPVFFNGSVWVCG